MPRRCIRAVVFDIGETLVDETRSWSLLAEQAGVTTLTLFGALGALIDRGEDHRQVWDLLGVARPTPHPEMVVADLYPDVAPTLQQLSARGLVLGLAGNQPASAEDALAAMGLPVTFVASSARWMIEKPDPAFFERVVSESGFTAPEIAYVGDRLDNDVLPAKEAGMLAIFVKRGPWGYLHAKLPDVMRADARIESLSELVELLHPD